MKDKILQKNIKNTKRHNDYYKNKRKIKTMLIMNKTVFEETYLNDKEENKDYFKIKYKEKYNFNIKYSRDVDVNTSNIETKRERKRMKNKLNIYKNIINNRNEDFIEDSYDSIQDGLMPKKTKYKKYNNYY